MVECKYKKTTIKDLANIPCPYRDKISKIIFEDIPHANNIHSCGLDISPMKGYPDTYRIRVGKYRIGLKIMGKTVVFYRIKSREEIYSMFP
nr:type II toxin-antitoxin system RelE/ParE family toxin [uncultured Methanospirillum sp.]